MARVQVGRGVCGWGGGGGGKSTIVVNNYGREEARVEERRGPKPTLAAERRQCAGNRTYDQRRLSVRVVPTPDVNAGSSTKLGWLFLDKRLWVSDYEIIRLHSALGDRPPAPEIILPPAQPEAYSVTRQSMETEKRRTLH